MVRRYNRGSPAISRHLPPSPAISCHLSPSPAISRPSPATSHTSRQFYVRMYIHHRQIFFTLGSCCKRSSRDAVARSCRARGVELFPVGGGRRQRRSRRWGGRCRTPCHPLRGGRRCNALRVRGEDGNGDGQGSLSGGVGGRVIRGKKGGEDVRLPTGGGGGGQVFRDGRRPRQGGNGRLAQLGREAKRAFGAKERWRTFRGRIVGATPFKIIRCRNFVGRPAQTTSP